MRNKIMNWQTEAGGVPNTAEKEIQLFLLNHRIRLPYPPRYKQNNSRMGQAFPSPSPRTAELVLDEVEIG